MKIAADSSPLITLAKISQLEILPELYRSILIRADCVPDKLCLQSAGSSELLPDCVKHGVVNCVDRAIRPNHGGRISLADARR